MIPFELKVVATGIPLLSAISFKTFLCDFAPEPNTKCGFLDLFINFWAFLTFDRSFSHK